jgi:pyruvate/2-oxoglutarate dehydrogenase complex dihydrolipoamide acyltransferase (E2) component
MTEGNIAKWNLKEGDSFSAGDVLLEIETDKASMDVEAQDDGILAKIVQGDGSKGIKVGTRIAILAEEGDDLASLEIPAEESASKKETKAESALKEESSKKEGESKQEEKKPAKNASGGKKGSAPAQTKPFFPAVEALLKEHNLTSEDVSQMTPSGPKGRLIKGDVLAYIGKTSSSTYASDLGSRLEKLSHLDLSNIKIPPPKSTKASAPEKAAKEVPKEEERTDVVVQISMKAVLEVQKRIQASLGVFLPISTFINRAVDLANDELPLPKGYKPTADELFNDILGLDKVVTSRGSRGAFVPQIAAFPPTASLVAPPRAKSSKKVDVLDQLIDGGKKSAFKREQTLVPGLSSGDNVFSVSVVKGEEKRAGVFLERVKVVLEGEPGRLVI